MKRVNGVRERNEALFGEEIFQREREMKKVK